MPEDIQTVIPIFGKENFRNEIDWCYSGEAWILTGLKSVIWPFNKHAGFKNGGW